MPRLVKNLHEQKNLGNRVISGFWGSTTRRTQKILSRLFEAGRLLRRRGTRRRDGHDGVGHDDGSGLNYRCRLQLAPEGQTGEDAGVADIKEDLRPRSRAVLDWRPSHLVAFCRILFPSVPAVADPDGKMKPPRSAFLLLLLTSASLLLLLASSSLALPTDAVGGLSKRYNWVLVTNRLEQPLPDQPRQTVKQRPDLQQPQQMQQPQQLAEADREDSLTQF
ncbi:unnamed protein product, partial [Darwinula stevensoni]